MNVQKQKALIGQLHKHTVGCTLFILFNDAEREQGEFRANFCD
jgi:hypothetical protein